MSELVDKLRGSGRRALARAMSRVDPAGRTDPAFEVGLRRSTGQVPWWGFTGPPGVGKSTLIDALLVRLREQGRRIGVVAVDPSSARSNGALLGDRVRMMRHAVDDDVFIRSLATHGHEGGLSDTTIHCARLMELAGYDPVVIETVGVGQNELDIASVADLCVVVLGPGHGDDIQLIKAGLLEIADMVVVNKCDLPESHRLLKEVREELAGAAFARSGGRCEPLAEDRSGSTTDAAGGPQVVELEAKSGRGVEKLLEQLLDLDRARRTPEAQAVRGERRSLGEIRRSAMAACGGAIERVLTSPEAKQWIAQLNGGESSLDAVVSQLAASALAEMQQPASDV
ncbi:MAG: ATP/GTP-binding protein [Pirellulaceae bacterium]|nr:ATP/GTP-binding protein [Pirellulaceae bacterium]